MKIDKERVREDKKTIEFILENSIGCQVFFSRKERTAIENILAFYELYLADKLVEPMSENDIASIINKLLMEHTHFHNGEQRFTPKSIVAFRECLVAEFAGKVGKRFVPASVDEIEKVINTVTNKLCFAGIDRGRIATLDSKITEALVGKVSSQFIPATKDEIETGSKIKCVNLENWGDYNASEEGEKMKNTGINWIVYLLIGIILYYILLFVTKPEKPEMTKLIWSEINISTETLVTAICGGDKK